MQEFATNSKSTNIGLRWRLHIEIKEGFQFVDLKRIFKFSMEIVDELIKKDLEEDAITLLKQLLPILENILTWSFLREKFMHILSLVLHVIQYSLLLYFDSFIFYFP